MNQDRLDSVGYGTPWGASRTKKDGEWPVARGGKNQGIGKRPLGFLLNLKRPKNKLEGPEACLGGQGAGQGGVPGLIFKVVP